MIFVSTQFSSLNWHTISTLDFKPIINAVITPFYVQNQKCYIDEISKGLRDCVGAIRGRTSFVIMWVTWGGYYSTWICEGLVTVCEYGANYITYLTLDAYSA